jgi:hypothetical protein
MNNDDKSRDYGRVGYFNTKYAFIKLDTGWSAALAAYRWPRLRVDSPECCCGVGMGS